MYTSVDFKSKKALKEAVKAYVDFPKAMTIGAVLATKAGVVRPSPVTIYSPGPFPCPENGRVALEGPHYPKPHSWYADCDVVDGIVVKVR